MTHTDNIGVPAAPPTGRGRQIGALAIGALVTICLTAVIAAPMALSAQDLYDWAAADRGLNLPGQWPLLVPLGLDAAAAVCIGFAVASVWRRDRPGVFSVLVWVFAGTSAYAQYTHGIAEQTAGRAQDAWWAMPTFALLGPLLLEIVLHTLRKWARKDAGEQTSAAAGFGNRWLVAPWETLQAWAASRREGIAKVDDAIKFVRERRALRTMDPVEQARYALSAIGVADAYALRLWCQARGVTVDQASIDRAFAGRPVAPVSSPPNAASSAADSYGQGVVFDHAPRLAQQPTQRDRIKYAFAAIGARDVPAAIRFLADYGFSPSRSDFYTVRDQEEQREQVALSGVPA